MEKKGDKEIIKGQPIPNLQKVPLNDKSTSNNQTKESTQDKSTKNK